MSGFKRIKNQIIAKIITRIPSLAKVFISAYDPLESGTPIPWAPVRKPLSQCKVALVTTSGIHHAHQPKFNMLDSLGDPSFRVLNGDSIDKDYMITHDYYDHSDAEKDLNIIFPIVRLKEMHTEGLIGELADQHYSLMGHIDGHHIVSLVEVSAKQIIEKLHLDAIDVVLLTPA